MKLPFMKSATYLLLSTLLFACQQEVKDPQLDQQKSEIIELESQTKAKKTASFYGTTLPFASEAVYFLMTDRFVDGDPSNNYVDQGGDYPTFRQPIVSEDGRKAYVGYMGGDFKGILDNAGYIGEMGFTSIWLTPIIDQPDEAFSGGEKIEFGGMFKDGGKTGYHGYWGVNFFKLDEHLPSKDLDFKALATGLKQDYQIKTVLDVVANHGSPSFTMKGKQQAKFGQLFDLNDKLVADHQNLEPKDLDPTNPLHQFFNTKPDIMQLSDLNQDNPAVLDYLTQSHLQWIGQGVDAIRIDTIKHMPHDFWKRFTDKIREVHPDLFMFAESFSYDANFIAEHTLAENGGISVLDFPGRETMLKVFENKSSDYSEILSYLHLTDGPYDNPYNLMTFYDNHDMSRINTDQNGFIDAHNWLFTSRGIPVVYYGSEIAFMAGTKEHEGNRNYFGLENIEKAKNHPIKTNLSKIANVRKNSIALQKGLQINLEFSGNKASFYRVYQHQGNNQTALVLLNKGDAPAIFKLGKTISAGDWKTAIGEELKLIPNQEITATVQAHGVSVYLLDEVNSNQILIDKMKALMNKEIVPLH